MDAKAIFIQFVVCSSVGGLLGLLFMQGLPSSAIALQTIFSSSSISEVGKYAGSGAWR